MIGRERPRVPGWARRAGAVALAGAALVASGCGGDDESAEDAEQAAREEYVADVREALEPITTQSQVLIGEAAQARSLQDLAKPLDQMERVYEDAAGDLSELDPPDEVADQHAELIDAHQDIARAAAQAERAAAQGDREGLDEFRRAGVEYSERAEEIGAQFAEQGIDF